MNLLDGHLVLVIGGINGPLARLLGSLGARVQDIQLEDLPTAVPHASFLLDRLGLARLSSSGWTLDRLQVLNPRLIHVSVTCFGSEAARGEWYGSELVASAMGGTLQLTGYPDRAPVKEALDACYFHAEMCAAAAAMAAHFERGESGRGQHVDVSVQEVALSRNVNAILVWQFDQRKLQRAGGALNYGRVTVRCIWPLADGWCFHTLMSGAFGVPANQAITDWIDELRLPNPMRGVDWRKYNRSTLDAATRSQWESALERFFRTLHKSDILGEGRRRGINATVLASPDDVLSDFHLQAREFWQLVEGQRLPGRFVRLTEGVPANASVHASAAPERKRPGPLAGVRVLDFSWALVGSITTKVLGDLGAEVIKIESRTRPCLSRVDVQVSASRADNLDDKPWFAHLNSSKKSVALDLKKPESREVLDPLIRWADLVVENFSPGTMTKLGLDFGSLQHINPAIVLISGSVFGQTGPLSQHWGVDGTGAALSGRTLLTGWPDRDPVIPGAVPYGDVIVPYVMAAAAAAALQYRRSHGRSCHVDASMYEICVQQMYAAIVAAQSGISPHRAGNQEIGVYQQGVYPVQGADRWMAISCPALEDWLRLRAAIGIADGSDTQARDCLLAEWTCSRSGEQAMQRLQSAGVAAGIVQDIEDLLEHDPQISARGALMTLEHPLLGAFGYIRTPVTFSRSTTAPFRAPSIGEHTAHVVRTLCGLSDARFDELKHKGVFE